MARPVGQGESIELNIETLTIDEGIDMVRKERVDPLLKYLDTGVFENKTNVSFMTAYSIVVQFGDQPQHTEHMYNFYVEVINTWAAESIARLKGSEGEGYLASMAELWEKHTLLVFWMQRVFQYLDRFFTQNEDNDDLATTGLRCFQENVYKDQKDLFVRAMLETINRERDGFEVDRSVLKSMVSMMCTINSTEPSVKKTRDATMRTERLDWVYATEGLYKDDFEAIFLQTTTDYYRRKIEGWLQERSCPEFLDVVERRLIDEEGRLDSYLNEDSRQPLMKVLHDELLKATAPKIAELPTGCKWMFENKRYIELTKMYRLFAREPSTLVHITEKMEPYIAERVTAVVEDQQKMESPTDYVEALLELKKEFDELVSQCFCNDTSFQRSRNVGIEGVLNKDSRCSKYLALFADHMMRKGFKGLSEEEVNAVVLRIVGLFSHLKDKDIFLDFYKTHLSKRLLNKQSVNNDAEDLMITRLKIECGQQSINKLALMFTDMGLSDQLQEQYRKTTCGGCPGGVTHEVRVLQTNCWPDRVDDADIQPSPELALCMSKYSQFYEAQHNGRRLKWMFNMGNAEVATHCFQKKYLLVVSTYQALLLILFNQQEEFSVQDLATATKIPFSEIKRQLVSMTAARNKVLVKDSKGPEVHATTRFKVHTKFSSDKMKVNVGLIKKETKEETIANPEPPAERKHVVDAAVVRVMKARKQLDHNSLLQEVFQICTLFKPQPQLVKQQIEHLIEREFLKRETGQKNMYIYLP